MKYSIKLPNEAIDEILTEWAETRHPGMKVSRSSDLYQSATVEMETRADSTGPADQEVFGIAGAPAAPPSRGSAAPGYNPDDPNLAPKEAPADV